MSKITRILTASLLDAAAIFIGVYGIIFSIATAYEINLNETTILLVLLFSSLCFSIIFNIGKYKKTLYISTAAVGAVLIYINAENIINGFLKFIHLITAKLSLFNTGIPVTKDIYLSLFGIINAYTAFFSFFAVILVLLLALALIKARSVWLASVISICSFAISLVFIKSVPDELPVFAFLVFLLSTILTSFIRKSTSKRASYMLSLFLPVTLVFLITINAIFPASTYNRTDIANSMYQFFAQRLPLTVKKGGSNNQVVSYVEGSDGMSFDPSISGINSTIHPNPKTAFDKIELNSASPSRSGEPVLKVKSSKYGSLLLRGFSLGNYTGNSWEQLKARELDSFYLLYETKPVGSNGFLYVTPLSMPTYFAMSANSKDLYSVTISETKEGGVIAYTPYFPVFNSFDHLRYGQDVYTLYRNNTDYAKNERAEYEIYAYSADDIENILNKISNTTRNSEEFRQIQLAEEIVRKAVYNCYTRIDNNTNSFLLDYTKDQNFQQITDRKALVEAVSKFVKQSAVYNVNTPTTPQGKDYLQYFLTESKQGYCMHFATEATLIFRMLGVPARYVTGYSISVANEEAGKWVNVSDKNAHAWTEVYFDGIGWIPVDVTPSAYRNPQNTSNPSSGAPVNPSTSIETSSKPPESSDSSESSSSEEESQLSSDTSSETTPPPPSKGISIPVWIYPVVLIIAAVLFLYFRRKRLLEKRRTLFAQKDTNKAVIVAWNYIDKLKVYGVSPEQSIYFIAQKAVFSKHTLSEEERKSVVSFAQEKAKELDNSLGFFKKTVFKFIKGLY